MRIENTLLTFFIFFILCFFYPHSINAGTCPNQCGGGRCDNEMPCGYQNVLVGACSNEESCNLFCYDEYTNCEDAANDLGLDIYQCDNSRGYPCFKECDSTITQGCFEEYANVWCCPTITPTNPPGGGTTTPTPTAPPTSTPFNVTVRTRVNNDAYLSGGVCQQASSDAQNISTGQVLLYNGNGYGQLRNLNNTNSAIFTLDTPTTYNLIVTVPKSDALQFSCPTQLSETTTTYNAMYSDVYISPTSNTTIDMFLKPNNLAADWFQVFGGHVFANNLLRSPIPSVTCGPSAACSDALIAALTSDPASSGHPFLLSTNGVNVQTSNSSADYHHFISPTTKTPNLNSYVTGFTTPQMSYQVLLELSASKLHTVAVGDRPDLWKSQAWWGQENFVLIDSDLNLDENSGFAVAAGDKLTVFISGNLTLNDSNPADTNRRITTAPRGSELIFIVQGSITINSTVGWTLDPAAPSTPAVTSANANLEGVFLANNRLIFQSNNAVGAALPDRKFIGAGTFVGWSGVELNRSFDDGGNGPVLASTQAVENFLYRPDFLSNWPDTLKVAVSNWRKMEPHRIESFSPVNTTITAAPTRISTIEPIPTFTFIPIISPTGSIVPGPVGNPEM